MSSKPSKAPSTLSRVVTWSRWLPIDPIRSANLEEVTRAVAPQSEMMYPASSGPRCQLTGVRNRPERCAAQHTSK
jgi:hypothetical protein